MTPLPRVVSHTSHRGLDRYPGGVWYNHPESTEADAAQETEMSEATNTFTSEGSEVAP